PGDADIRQAEELTWPKMRQGEEKVEKLPSRRQKSVSRPVSWGKRVQLGMLATVLVTGGIVGLRSLSRVFTHQGVNCFKTSRYDCAQSYLQWALWLNPQNAKARNNLGVVYGALQEDAKARPLFKQSKIQGNPAACNNAAHDQIKTENYAAAANLLQVCLQQVLTKDSELGEYVIRKNLGWSLFEQGYYDEAEKHLRFALSINQRFQQEGPANCVLAQVLDAKNQPQAALPQWKFCLNARDSIPEEAEWKRLAKQQLQAQTH
ncbi:MAG: tetratricopeptide repeat protein, partial [Kamptonema sp. SIO4C4]|nr:tetratricopeptide repeat protein [Kamptonema sp. SIO4C4]